MFDRTKLFRRAALSAIGALVAAPIADAQQAPQPDPTSIWTIQDENSTITSAKLSDRYYTNGLRLGLTSGTGSVPDFLNSAARVLWGDGQTRISFDLSQQIYTPKDTETYNPPLGDRPYAGILMGNFSMLTDTPGARSTVGVGLGVVGPWALGEQVQNGFHDLIGQGHNNGWHYQLRNEPAFEITRHGHGGCRSLRSAECEIDALPELGRRPRQRPGVRRRRRGDSASARGWTAITASRACAPGMSGGDAFKPTRPFVWYVFAGADGQAVAQDITLDGNTFQNSRSVKLKPLVGEIESGLAVMAFGARLTYTQVLPDAGVPAPEGRAAPVRLARAVGPLLMRVAVIAPGAMGAGGRAAAARARRRRGGHAGGTRAPASAQARRRPGA